jgi:hypothetical protein
MNFRVSIMMVLILILLAACQFTPTPSPTIPGGVTPSVIPPVTTTPSTDCVVGDQIPYVYHDYRLAVQAPCIRVLAHIDLTRNEADGDVHIFAHLSPTDSAKYLTPGNAHEQGDLVVEPICVNTPTQADAIQPCANDPDPMRVSQLPATGACVWIEGRYVQDTMHYSWAEIHPVGKFTLATAADCANAQISIRVFSDTDAAFPDPGD